MSWINWAKYGISGVPATSRTGAENVKVLCPKCHNERTNKTDKSLSCNLKTGEFKCHYCGFSGNATEYSEEEKKEWMKQQTWYDPAKARKEHKEYRRPKPRKASPMSDKALAWFRSRGISQATLQAMKVTEGLEFMPQKEAKWNTVQFNYYLNGELVNTKFRTGDKCFKLCQGAELLPYNIDAIRGTKECIVTEGEIDALSFYEAGRHDVVSVPNGANANLTYLDDYMEEYFEDKDTIYIASDTDTKGVVLRDELIRRFGAERCKVVTYGEGCKDANEHLMKYGQESLLACLENAQEIKLEGVFTVSDFETSLDAIFENGLQKGVTVGHENLDRLISFETKRLCVVTGIPGSGKSEFIDELAERLNIRYGWRWAYFSPENAPLAYHASKLIEKFTGRKFSSKSLPENQYRQVKKHLESNFFFIAPDGDYKVDSILDRAKFLVRRKGIKGLVIDPYNRLENEQQGGRSETQYISGLLDRLTMFAQRNDILVVLMAHPTKMSKNKDGQVEVPTLYDISGSANFYNKADFGIVIHRDRINNTVEVRIQKVKFRHLGSVGTAYFKYNQSNGRYVPFYNGQEPKWDSSNHLVEELRKREEEAAEQARLDFDFTENQEECPF